MHIANDKRYIFKDKQQIIDNGVVEMSFLYPIYYSVKQLGIPILLEYYIASNPVINYTFLIQNTNPSKLYFRPRSDILYSSSIVGIDPNTTGAVNLTLYPAKQSDGVNQTFNVYIDVCTDSSCGNVVQTDQFPLTIYWRKLSSINILSRFTFDDGTVQGWNSTVNTGVSTSFAITPSYSLHLNYYTGAYTWSSLTVLAPQVTNIQVNDAYLVFLGQARRSNFRKISIYVNDVLRHVSQLDVRDRWLYFVAYLGYLDPSSIVKMQIDTYNSLAGGDTDLYFDDITFFTL